MSVGYRRDTVNNPAYAKIQNILAREYGVFTLAAELQLPHNEDNYNILVAYFMKATFDRALDMIELTFKVITAYDEQLEHRDNFGAITTAAEAIEELNARFLEHGVGYAFVSRQLIRKDGEFVHKEVVLPALQLLHEQKFAGANDEYLRAHEHYRRGNYKECLNECLKSFESVMKTICKRRRWLYKETDTAKALIDTCLQKGLILEFLQSHCAALRTTLESSVPTVRNKLGGHGQGSDPAHVPAYYAAYLLHQTAAIIQLFIEADKAL